MDSYDVIKQLIDSLAAQIEIREVVIKSLAAGLAFLCTVIGSFFFIYRKDKKISDDKYVEMSKELTKVIQENTKSHVELKETIRENTRAVERMPDLVMTSIKLAMKP